MIPSRLVLAGLFCLGACVSSPPETAIAHGNDGTPCIADKAALMAMDYWTFDQAPDGLRAVYIKPGCELSAADLVRDFHAALRARGEPVTHMFPAGTVTFSETGEMPILYWHEGQMRAFEGQTEEAIRLFRLSGKPEQKNAAGWNQYVFATIAFLEGDRAELEAQRMELAARVAPDDLNLGVVDGLLVCFGRSYKDAYGAPECDRRPERPPLTP